MITLKNKNSISSFSKRAPDLDYTVVFNTLKAVRLPSGEDEKL